MTPLKKPSHDHDVIDRLIEVIKEGHVGVLFNAMLDRTELAVDNYISSGQQSIEVEQDVVVFIEGQTQESDLTTWMLITMSKNSKLKSFLTAYVDLRLKDDEDASRRAGVLMAMLRGVATHMQQDVSMKVLRAVQCHVEDAVDNIAMELK